MEWVTKWWITLDSERQHRTKGSFAKAQVSLGSAHRQATDVSMNARFSFSALCGVFEIPPPFSSPACLPQPFSWLDPYFSNNTGCMGDGVTVLLHLTLNS